MTLHTEPTEDSVINGCAQAVDMLRSQKNVMSREFRQIKRELGLLKVTMEKPGLSESLRGIGHLLGLFGLSY